MEKFDLLAELQRPTAYKEPPTFVEPDPDPVKTAPEPESFITTESDSGAAGSSDAPVKQSMDAEFTTDIGIDIFDTVQHGIFLKLTTRKLKKRMFKTDEAYLEAVRLSNKPASQLDDEEKVKVDTYELYRKLLKERSAEIELKEDEHLKLAKPLNKLVVKHNIDLPPGYAMVLSISTILSERIIDMID